MTCIHRFIHLSLCLMILICRYNLLLLDFAPSCNTYLKHHVSEASNASFFKQETLNLFDPVYRPIISYWIPLKPSLIVDKLLRTELARGL
jgi:hypothetical protein